MLLPITLLIWSWVLVCALSLIAFSWLHDAVRFENASVLAGGLGFMGLPLTSED